MKTAEEILAEVKWRIKAKEKQRERYKQSGCSSNDAVLLVLDFERDELVYLVSFITGEQS